MVSMRNWPRRDRPRERLREKGPAALSDSEILALVVGNGCADENAVETARRILSLVGGVDGLPGHGLGSLARIRGIGEAKASRIVAALELGTRVVERRATWSSHNRFECSADIFESYRARLGLLGHEVFVVIGLNSRNELIKEMVVGTGSVNECRIEPPEVFRPLIAEAAARTLLLHNHPSGDPTPSPHDIAVTRRLVQVGKVVGIPVLDHVVIGRGSYTSLRDLGILGDV